MTLTHVCRSFRHVALNRPKLWTCLSKKLGRTGIELIEACIERSKNEPLDVVLYLYGFRESGSVDGVVVVDSKAWITVLPLCTRWRSYSVHLIIVDPLNFEQWENVTLPSELHPLLTNLDVPLLEEFSIEEEADVLGLFPESTLLRRHPLLPPNASWNLPALHSLSLRNSHISHIPSEFRRSLRSASLSYIQRSFVYHLTNTLRHLTIATSLTTLELSFNNCHFSRNRVDPSPSVFPHIKLLRVDFLGCSQRSDEHTGSLWKSFRTLQFPGVVDPDSSLRHRRHIALAL